MRAKGSGSRITEEFDYVYYDDGTVVARIGGEPRTANNGSSESTSFSGTGTKAESFTLTVDTFTDGNGITTGQIITGEGVTDNLTYDMDMTMPQGKGTGNFTIDIETMTGTDNSTESKTVTTDLTYSLGYTNWLDYRDPDYDHTPPEGSLDKVVTT